MPRPFAITAASNSVFLDEDRTGRASFTVSNQSGRAIEGRARLVTPEPEAEAWFALQGSAQREFATAGTQQYTIAIDVPPDAPSGNYSMRLDMVGEERPDEQYVEGPTVTFQVPEPEPASAPFPWKIVAAVVAVLLIGGGVIAYSVLSGPDEPATATVPAVSGLTVPQATDSLENVGFETVDMTEEESDSISQGRVIRTVPTAHATAPVDSSVLLYVSLGPSLVRIPEVENLPLLDAVNQLATSNLQAASLSSETHESIPENRVIRTDPPANQEVPEGSDLTLVVSSGPPTASENGGYSFPGLNQSILNNQVIQPNDTISLTPQMLERLQNVQPNQ